MATQAIPPPPPTNQRPEPADFQKKPARCALPLENSTPQYRIGELRVWSYEPLYCVRAIIVRLN
jgi:hypothetical protein